MTRNFLLFGLATLLVATTGCAMCSHPYDYDYGAFGGTWERVDSTSGRVGSVFHEAGVASTAANEPAATVNESDAEESNDDSVLLPRTARLEEPEDMPPEPDLIFIQ